MVVSSCANSGHYKPLCACVDRTLSFQIRRPSVRGGPEIFAPAVRPCPPIGTGVVVSLAKPGGNITGLSVQQPDLAGKRLEILREAVPGLQRLAIIGNTGAAGSIIDMDETEN